MKKGLWCVFIKFNTRIEAFNFYKDIKKYLNEDVSYRTYPDINDIHYISISINKKIILQNEYEFLSGIYTQTNKNVYKTYLLFTYEDYQHIKNKYRYSKIFLPKEKKEFIKEFNEKIKS